MFYGRTVFISFLIPFLNCTFITFFIKNCEEKLFFEILVICLKTNNLSIPMKIWATTNFKLSLNLRNNHLHNTFRHLNIWVCCCSCRRWCCFALKQILIFYFSATEIECYIFCFFLFSQRVQILKTEYKYGQYCTPLSQSD